MPSKDMNSYMKERYRKRRQDAIEKLGGKCVFCGTCQDLQFDHIDRTDKIGTIAKLSSASNEKFNKEVEKCQLLCSSCHIDKSREDGSYGSIKKDYTCVCGKYFENTRQYAGHRRWCRK